MGTFDVHAMLSLGRVGASAVSPDGSTLVVEVARLDDDGTKLVPQLDRVEIASGRVARLTRDPRGARAPAFRSDGAVAFLRRAGDDLSQVFVLGADGGEALAITDEPLGVSAFAFAKSADVLVVETPVLVGVPPTEQREAARVRRERGTSMLRFTETPARYWDSWIEPAATHLVAIDAHGRRDLTPSADREHRPRPLEPSGWSVAPDGSFLIAVARTGQNVDRTDRFEVRRIDTASGETRVMRLRPQAEYGAPIIAPNGRTFALTEQVHSKEALGPRRIVLVDITTTDARTVAEDWDAWPDPAVFTPDGHDLIVAVDERGERHLYGLHLATGTRTRITAPGGTHDVTGLTPEGKHVIGLRSTLRAPAEPFACDLEANAEPELVARLSGLAAPLDHFTVESFDVTSRDGTTVQSFLVRPRDVARPKVILWIHGGPISQFVDGWHWRWCAAVLADAGYAVVMANPRGSTGRGQAFVDGVWNNRWGAECYDDLMAIADHVQKRDDLDGDHMAAMGGSFGGYMSNFIGGSTNRFRAIVTHASIFHFEAFAWSTDMTPWFYAELDGHDPATDREHYDRYSPHRRVDAWKTPTLILHGEKDYRCPIGDGLMLFEALQARGVVSELAIFPDENHFIQKPKNIAAWYETVIEFLGKHL